MIICVAANPSIDKLFEVEHLVPGAIHRPIGFVRTAGGKGLNVARAAHSLGADVLVAGILMGHAGRWLEETLQGEGIPGAFVWTEGESRSSLSVAGRDTAGLTEFYEQGPTVTVAAWAELKDAVYSRTEPGCWLTISGSLPRGAPPDGYRELTVQARHAGMRVALDTDGEPLRLALAAEPDIVKVNAAEASGTLGLPATGLADALAAAKDIRRRVGGPGHAAVVTRGIEGAVVAAPEGMLFEGALDVRGRYPVGSGDAFLAALVVALDRDSDWPSALRLALGTAGANAELPGAGIFDPARAGELALRAEVRELDPA